MSDSPPERDVEWTAAGAEAAWKHLQRIWRIADEIDNADIEFPNDLLLELDKMEFFVYETQERIVAKHRPIIIITSNTILIINE